MVHFVVLSFLCHIWTYYCKAFLWYCWLFVSIVLLQFDSQSPSLCSNYSFSFLIFFLNYICTLIFTFIYFIGCTGFLWVFFLPFVLLCIFFFVLFFVLLISSSIAMSFFFFFDFHIPFVSFLLHVIIFVYLVLILSISFDFGYYIGPFLCFLLLSLFHSDYCCGKG